MMGRGIVRSVPSRRKHVRRAQSQGGVEHSTGHLSPEELAFLVKDVPVVMMPPHGTEEYLNSAQP